MFKSVQDLIDLCQREHLPVWEVMTRQEMETLECSREDVRSDMENKLQVMMHAIMEGLSGVQSHSGLSGGDAARMQHYLHATTSLCGPVLTRAIAGALAVNEVNASMGIICATPTAGSAGVVPGVLYGIRKRLKLSGEEQVNYLLSAGAFGLCIGNQAPLAGASGGCQAEVGSASGMAAAACVLAAGGTVNMAADALAMALKNILGLVCDPVAGLVEIPCIKRNSMGVANALAAAEMAMAGIRSKIPADEVIEAMGRIGQNLPTSLRETALGGLATTPTGQRLSREVRERLSQPEKR